MTRTLLYQTLYYLLVAGIPVTVIGMLAWATRGKRHHGN